ncbi:MAG TPA: inositol monophosphatase family protein [Actinokineospora sp.]|jgi:myo-inositol-1(or 4)-monophosphatase|nr:inositol monophosphatase family protein [Actinokineospora sp.]
MNDDLERMLDHAVAAVTEAGELIASMHARRAVDVDYKDGVEPVTSADLACDALLQQCVLGRYPRHRILSEEGAASDDLTGPVWVIDPIDGTANYARGHRYVAISAAFCVNGVAQVGVVHAPWLGETFTAIRGGGAHLNGTRIEPSAVTELARSVVSTGFPQRRDGIEPLVERVRRLLTQCQDIRRAASPALDICWVAAGRLDAHTESLAPWDVAAACLVATEAGAIRGRVTDRASTWPPDLCGDGLLVSAPGVHEDLKRLLAGIEGS